MAKSIKLTRLEATHILKSVGLKIPMKKDVEGKGVWEAVLPSGAKIKIWETKGPKWAKFSLAYWIEGYADDGTDVTRYTSG